VLPSVATGSAVEIDAEKEKERRAATQQAADRLAFIPFVISWRETVAAPVPEWHIRGSKPGERHGPVHDAGERPAPDGKDRPCFPFFVL
jgi:hypothetical protein